jgi:hypothetical protein
MTETADRCYYFISCEFNTIISTVDLTGDEWNNCFFDGFDNFYRLTGIDGLEACAFTANFCLNFPEVVASVVQCEVDVDDTPDGTCQYINECTQPLDLGHGATAHVDASWTMISCYPGQTGGEGCECSDSDFDSRSFSVDSLDAANPCDTLSAICFDDEPFDIGRAAGTQGACEAEPASATAEQCQVEEVCTYAKPYDDTTTLSVTEVDTAQCTNFEGDEWSCQCDASGVRFLRMSLAPETSSEAACGSALEVCRQPTLEGNGPLTCVQDMTTTEVDECRIDFECDQPMTAGPHNVIRNASGFVFCYPAQDGWECECRYDQTGELLTLAAPLNSTEVCAQATATCTAKVEL